MASLQIQICLSRVIYIHTLWPLMGHSAANMEGYASVDLHLLLLFSARNYLLNLIYTGADLFITAFAFAFHASRNYRLIPWKLARFFQITKMFKGLGLSAWGFPLCLLYSCVKDQHGFLRLLFH